jgi:hypothetical protein
MDAHGNCDTKFDNFANAPNADAGLFARAVSNILAKL